MNENGAKIGDENRAKNPPLATMLLRQDDVVVQQKAARASNSAEDTTAKIADMVAEVPMKKRRTRRGKSKRRNPYPRNGCKSSKVIKPEAPYNSNQFLLEDHGTIVQLDANLAQRHHHQRTRDSSLSGLDTDGGDFYSSPDDEEQFLIRDFVDQYESVQAERLQGMTKDELINEYLLLEGRLERQRKRVTDERPLQAEVERLTSENEALRRELSVLRSKEGSSEDSETDSDDSCSSSSSSASASSHTTDVDYTQTNGHTKEVGAV